MNNSEPAWQPACQLADLKSTGAVEIVLGEHIIAVLLDGEAVYAIDAVCAHQGGPIAKGTVADGCVTCPWHGWRYALEDGCNTATGKPMLQTYPTRVAEGVVQVLV